MTGQGIALFDTTIGRCGIAWTDRGIVRVQLPERTERETRARLLGCVPQAPEAAPPSDVQCAIEQIVALLRGDRVDLSAIALDMERLPPFHRRVYEVARTIQAGATLSYGEVAARLGVPAAARAVGQALGRNPFAIVVPCHRVLAAGGKIGGFSATGGSAMKSRLLAIEGAAGSGHTRDPVALFGGDGALGFDPALAVSHLHASDAVLGRLIDAVGPLRLQLKRTPSIFVALMEAIIYQQLSGKAAATIFGRLCGLFPGAGDGPTPEQILRTPDDRLRSAGLSRPKLRALRDLAQRAADGTLPSLVEVQGMDDATVIERLTEVRGVGRWTVEMLLIFRLGRPDVLPADDYGVRKGFALAFRQRTLPTREALERRGARWAPYRTAASWYLWRALDVAKP